MNNILQSAKDAISGNSKKKEPTYQNKVFQLRDIPNVMRTRLNWPVASKLMERWFNGAAYQISPDVKGSLDGSHLDQLPSSQLDETTVTMEWALGYARVHAAMTELQKKWASPAGIKQLKARVNQSMLGRTNQCWRLGDLAQPAKYLDASCQVNYLVFGQMSDPLDDFYGAMGEAQMKVAVSGMVTPQGPNSASIVVDELGFYLRDSYDFNDGRFFISQPLGCWGFNGMECGVATRMNVPIETQVVDEPLSEIQGRKYLVQNEHFRQWRAKNQKGGDFMVLSNVKRVKLPFSQTVAW